MENNTATIAGQRADYSDFEAASSTPFMSFRMSWLAYLALIRIFIVRLFVFGILSMIPVYFFSGPNDETHWAVLLAPVLAVLSVVYEFLALRAIVLFTDESGVWVSRGVFPWQKGVFGVKWRDVSEATYETGFTSWALQSYSVRVGQRFTNDAEVFVKNVHRGNVAVEHINAVLARYR